MGKSGPITVLGLLLLVGGSGCATCPAKITAALNQATSAGSIADSYTLSCPDRILIWIDGRPELSQEVSIEPDGYVSLRQIGRVRVEGMSSQGVAELIARSMNTSAKNVKVTVLDHASRHIVIYGPGDGVQRVIPYIGSENVTGLLRRTGGLAPGAAYHEIHVVRPHVAAGRRPEVFPVDLKRIVIDHDPIADIQLEPNDQVYIGETKGASVARCLPPWVRAIMPGMKQIDEK